MISYVTSFFNKNKKPVPRDKHGRPINRPNHLSRLLIWQRYPAASAIVVSFAGACMLFAAPIYQSLFLDPNDYDEQATWWPHEKRNGKRDIDIIRERKAEYPDGNPPISYLFKRYDRQEARKKEREKARLAAEATAELNQTTEL